jgi:hypothetical protein
MGYNKINELEVLIMAGWERSLVTPLATLVDIYPNFDINAPAVKKIPSRIFGKDRKKVKQLSPNHHELGVVLELFRASAYGTDEEWKKAREVHTFVLNQHLYEVGLWTGEQYTGTPHGGFYLAALFAARMAFLVRKERSALTPNDLLYWDLLDEYTVRVFDYMELASTKNGEVIMAGERMPKGPLAVQQSAVLRELKGLPQLDPTRIRRQIHDEFWLPLRAVRKLLYVTTPADKELETMIAVRFDEDKIDSLPFTAQPVRIDRWAGGHRAFYTSEGGDGTCRWVWTHRGSTQWGINVNEIPNPPEHQIRTWITDEKGN